MVIANPPLAEPVIDPGGVTIKPPFEMGVANLNGITLWIKGCCYMEMIPFYGNFSVCRNIKRQRLLA